MGLAYGIKIARQTLEKLTTERGLLDRLTDAWSEIEVMEPSDVYDFGEIEKWKLDFEGLTLEEKKSEESIKHLRNLSLTLVNICTEIIEQNSKDDSENAEEGGGD
jgi:hypothetical protein